MQRVLFSQLTDRHIKLLAESIITAPEDVRFEPEEIIAGIKNDSAELYEFECGIVLVSYRRKTLFIEAITMVRTAHKPLSFAAPLLKAVAQLAADRGCDKIKTTVFDKRYADVIVKLGGKVESYDLAFPLGAE